MEYFLLNCQEIFEAEDEKITDGRMPYINTMLVNSRRHASVLYKIVMAEHIIITDQLKFKILSQMIKGKRDTTA